MARRIPVVIDGEAREVRGDQTLNDIVPAGTTAVSTSDGQTFKPADFGQHTVEELEARGFKTHQSDVVRACQREAQDG